MVITWATRPNAKVVEEAGLGLWERDRDWGVDRIVKGEEIERKIAELMMMRSLRESQEGERRGQEGCGKWWEL
ncbi:hypothetical protein NL676_008168 [Syzygium grande]|nr:hypothetical protein NL676_008168 [Syzygium grande]